MDKKITSIPLDEKFSREINTSISQVDMLPQK